MYITSYKNPTSMATQLLEKGKKHQLPPANLDTKVPSDGPRFGVRGVGLPKHHSACLHNIQPLPDLQRQKKRWSEKKTHPSRKSENYCFKRKVTPLPPGSDIHSLHKYRDRDRFLHDLPIPFQVVKARKAKSSQS